MKRSEKRMKRAKPLKRFAPLKTSQVPRALRLAPASKETGFVKGRYRASRAEWTMIRRRKFGPCRVCGSTLTVGLHHLVERDEFGDDVPENLIPLCGSGTMLCHGIYTQKKTMKCGDGVSRTYKQVCDRIRRTITVDEKTYFLRRVTAWGPAASQLKAHNAARFPGVPWQERHNLLDRKYPLIA